MPHGPSTAPTSIASLAGSALGTGKLERWTKGAAPALALRDEKRVEHSLAALAGRAVLVNFWATWCEPCREEMPSMVKLAEKMAGRPFSVLAVNVGESEAAANRFYAYGVVARLALLAASIELEKTDPDQSRYG